MPVINPSISHYGSSSRQLFPNGEKFGMANDVQNFEPAKLQRSKSATTLATSLKSPFTSDSNNSSNINHQKSIEKLVKGLPDGLQRNIVDVAYLLSSSANHHKMICMKQNIELKEMQSTYNKTNTELQNAQQNLKICRQRVADVEERYFSLKDTMGLKDKRSAKGQITITKLNSTNLALIDSLNALERKESTLPSHHDNLKHHRTHSLESHDSPQWFSPPMKAGSRPPSLGMSSGHESPALKKSISFPLSPGTSGKEKSHMFPEEDLTRQIIHGREPIHVKSDSEKMIKGVIDPSLKDEKLRNALLNSNREKYRSNKKVELLGNENESLKKKLEVSELRCRHLEISFAELTGEDNVKEFAFNLTATGKIMNNKIRDYGVNDHLFKALIEKRTINPVESILQFRRMFHFMTRIPGTLKIQNVAGYLCSQHIMQVLDVDMICIYILDLDIPMRVSKYTIRSEKFEEVDISGSKSIVGDVIQRGKLIRHSDVKSSMFHTEIDGCPGILIRNILSVPLIDVKTNQTIGAIHLLNKFEGTTSFSTLDEIFAVLYAEMAVTSILSCQKYQHVSFRADVLTSILASSSRLLSLIPDSDSLYVTDISHHEVLQMLEDCTVRALKCLKVKAFLVSNQLDSMNNGFLLSIQERNTNVPQHRQGVFPFLLSTSFLSGVAGFVAKNKKWTIQADGKADIHAHPEVDLDLHRMPCVTAPILDLKGDLIGCLQMVCGSSSPKINLSDSRADGVTFEQSVQCLLQTISPPLQCILAKIGAYD